MGSTRLPARYRQADRRGARSDLISASLQRRGHSRHRPFEKLADRHCGHRRELKVRALPDVEAPRAGLVLLLIVDEPPEVLRADSLDPVLLQRLTAVEAGVQVRVAE